jgi:RNA polymerase sigma factor (sigma-70 family)
MATPQLAGVVRHICRLVGAPGLTDKADGQLLRDFHSEHDQAAFAILVDRHGALVWRVCRQVLERREDAEDAFQATFLVLARKAAALQKMTVLAGWLRGVAYRIALQARRNEGRRRAREAGALSALPANPAVEAAWREVQIILHEEIGRLGAKYQSPFVLCCLEGRSRADVAAQLQIKEGTVWSRLCQARRVLQKRLARRGIELGAVLAAGSIAESAAAKALPALLVAKAVRTAADVNSLLAAQALTGQTSVAPKVAALAQAVLASTGAGTLKVGVAVLLLAGVLGAGLGMAALQTDEKAPPTQPAAGAKPDDTKKSDEKKPGVDAHGDPLPEGAIIRLGTVRFNHGTDLSQLLFTPDGKTIISAGRFENSGAAGKAWRPGNGLKGLVRLWDAATGAETARFSQNAEFDNDTVIALQDGKTLVALNEEFSGDVARWWDLSERKEIRQRKLPVRRGVFSVSHKNALSPDGKLAAIHVHTPAELRVFDLATGQELHKFTDGGKDIRTVVFAGNDRLVTADKKGQIAVLEARTGKVIRRIDHGKAVDFLAPSSDGRLLAAFERNNEEDRGRQPNRDVLYVFDLDKGGQVHALRFATKRLFQNAVFSPDGKQIATSSFDDSYTERLTVWDLATERKVREAEGELEGAGSRLAYSPDGKRLAHGEGEGGNAGKFDVWDLETGRRVSSPDSRLAVAWTVCLSKSGDSVFTFGGRAISSWDSATGRRRDSLSLPPDLYFDRSSQSAHGRFAQSFVREGGKYHAVVWDVADKRKRLTVPAPGEQVGATALSGDGSLLATSIFGKETAIRVWHTATGKEVRSFKGPSFARAFFSRDNKRLFIAGPKITAFDIASGKELFSWRMEPLPSARRAGTFVVGGAPFDENTRVAWRALAISPDERTIAAIHWNTNYIRQEDSEKRIAIYELATGRLLHQWNDSGIQSSFYEALTFSDDGRLLASSDGPVVHLWEALTGTKLRSFEGHRADVTSVGFDGDGRRLVSAAMDHTVVVWDLTGRLHDGKLAPSTLSAPEIEVCWKLLAGRDADKAYRAVWDLTVAGADAIAFIKRHVSPVPHPDPKRITKLVGDLGHEEFAVRQSATTELKKLDVPAEGELRKRLQANPPLELRRRIEALLKGIENPVPAAETLRAIRALAVLEHVASPVARQHLQVLADGAPAARVTREARAALDRLADGS